MTIYTNLPIKEKDNLDDTRKKLTEDQYVEEFQFNAGEYDAAIAFFVKSVVGGFQRRGPLQHLLSRRQGCFGIGSTPWWVCSGRG